MGDSAGSDDSASVQQQETLPVYFAQDASTKPATVQEWQATLRQLMEFIGHAEERSYMQDHGAAVAKKIMQGVGISNKREMETVTIAEMQEAGISKRDAVAIAKHVNPNEDADGDRAGPAGSVAVSAAVTADTLASTMEMAIAGTSTALAATMQDYRAVQVDDLPGLEEPLVSDCKKWVKQLAEVIRGHKTDYTKLKLMAKDPTTKQHPVSEAAASRILDEARASVSEILDAVVTAKHPANGFEYVFEVLQCAINKDFASIVQWSETFVFRVTAVTNMSNIEGAVRTMKLQAEEVRYYEAKGIFKMIVNATMVKFRAFPTIMARITALLPVETQHGLTSVFAAIAAESNTLISIMPNTLPATQTTPIPVAPRPIPKQETQSNPVICRNFARFGQCRFGDKCNFLHQANAVANVAVAQEPITEDEQSAIELQEHINLCGMEATMELVKQVQKDALPVEDWTGKEEEEKNDT